ncbi:hypothetical protein T190115A13A_130089 [Tenacibaculum sp. 190524A02b]|uniref:Lipoprotein n=1 Tax=Tenacibaculum vairaonense TaxID=3137860 RepID=A0ABM9PHY4_9FLAO
MKSIFKITCATVLSLISFSCNNDNELETLSNLQKEEKKVNQHKIGVIDPIVETLVLNLESTEAITIKQAPFEIVIYAYDDMLADAAAVEVYRGTNFATALPLSVNIPKEDIQLHKVANFRKVGYYVHIAWDNNQNKVIGDAGDIGIDWNKAFPTIDLDAPFTQTLYVKTVKAQRSPVVETLALNIENSEAIAIHRAPFEIVIYAYDDMLADAAAVEVYRGTNFATALPLSVNIPKEDIQLHKVSKFRKAGYYVHIVWDNNNNGVTGDAGDIGIDWNKAFPTIDLDAPFTQTLYVKSIQ